MTRNKSKKKRQTTIEASLKAGEMARSSPIKPRARVRDSDDNDNAFVQTRFSFPNKSSPTHPSSTFSLHKSNKRARDSSDDDDSDDAPLISPRRSQPKAKKKNAIIVVQDDTDKENNDDDDEEDDLPIATPRSSNPRGSKRALPVDDDDDDDDDDIVIRSSPAKKRRLARKSSPVGTSSQQFDQLNMYSSVKLRGARGARPRTEKEKQRELLRRRRAGEKIEEEDLSSSSDEGQGALYDTDSDLEVLDKFEDEEEEEEQESETEEPKKKSKKDKKKGKEKAKKKEKRSKDRRASVLDDEDPDEDDLDDFVVSDDDGPLGAPADLEIPLEFTRAAHKSLKEYFRDVIEWLVHKRINASFDSEQEIHSLAFRKLNDEVMGLANSSYVSSVWKENFSFTIRARPYIEHWELPKGSDDRDRNCFACNRTNHPCTYVMKFSGKPYNKDTLEALDDDESSDSSGDDGDKSTDPNDANVDHLGFTLLPESYEFFVGVHCGNNAVIAHKLLHWRHALQDFVHEHLEECGWLEAQKCKEREAMKPRKRAKTADMIVKEWEDKGSIVKLWHNFKDMLDEARAGVQKKGRWGH